MCQQLETMANNKIEQQKMKSSTTYTIKKVLMTFFKKQQKSSTSGSDVSTSTACSSCEDFENLRNMQTEQQYYSEIDDNMINEKLANMSVESVHNEEEEEEADIYVPVRFARTEAGTFFWTTNLQPVTNTIIPAADEDLLQPAYCYSNYQYPLMQYQDRWAQA